MSPTRMPTAGSDSMAPITDCARLRQRDLAFRARDPPGRGMPCAEKRRDDRLSGSHESRTVSAIGDACPVSAGPSRQGHVPSPSTPSPCPRERRPMRVPQLQTSPVDAGHPQGMRLPTPSERSLGRCGRRVHIRAVLRACARIGQPRNAEPRAFWPRERSGAPRRRRRSAGAGWRPRAAFHCDRHE